MKDSLDSTHGNLVDRNYDDCVGVNGGVIAIYHYIPPPSCGTNSEHYNYGLPCIIPTHILTIS